MNNSNPIIIYGTKSFQKNNKIFVNEKIFQLPIISVHSSKKTLEFLEEIQNSFLNNKSFLELFEYNDCSLWWFLHPTLFPEIKKNINFIIKFETFLNDVHPSIVKISDDFKMFSIIKQLCIKHNIKFEYSKKNFLKYKIREKILHKGSKYRYKKIFNNKEKTRKKIFYNMFKNKPSLNNKIIFSIPTIYRREIINLKNSKSENGEYIQQEIMELISKKEKIFGIDLDYTFRGDSKILLERLNTDSSWAPLEIFLNYSNEQTNHKKFLKNYSKIINDNNFQQLFSFNGISFWKEIEFFFTKMSFIPYIPFYLNMLDSFAQLFLKEKPKAIFLTYETGPLALPLIIIAQKYKIKTIGISHAIIHRQGDPMHSFHPIRNIENPLGYPIPDQTLLFGNFSKEGLINSKYPMENFTVFGNPSFFNLDKIIQILENRSLYEKYDIKKNQKVILLTTEYLQAYYNVQGKFDYDTQILLNLLDNFSNNENFVVIIKPHPSENIQEYEKVIKKYGTNNFRIIQGNLFELIHISSLVISVYSNSMMDALCLKKPVIRVIFDQQNHGIPYDEFDVIVSCHLKNLSSEIKNILTNNKLQQKLLKNRDTFIKNQYNIPENNPQLILQKILEDD
jgi:hypothetical protein